MPLARQVALQSWSRKQQETVPVFLAELLRLATKCEFEGLEKWLLDQFTWGQTDVRLQHQLMSVPEMDLTKGLTLLAAAEQTPWEGHHLSHSQGQAVYQGTLSDSDCSDAEEDGSIGHIVSLSTRADYH
ncbi:hypothetical protein JRQ81_014584 [Phrynocephalus forsythii]|uniref:Uncharacterized protein n=1 Tax=Phrynocephalus forsythii TaxID=171643 RepID=A0A9Q0XWZ8_9SAUR|nr:hypothetical protein JRQ81_014584 [Phrynocephalus forsythii]